MRKSKSRSSRIIYLDSTNKPKEADEWYKQALERARNIAKNIGNSSNTAKEAGNDVSPKAVSESMIHSPHDQKQGLNCKIGKLI